MVIGIAYTAVSLSDGSLGLAASPRDKGCRTHSRAGELARMNATELAREPLSSDPLGSVLGLTTVNAASSGNGKPSPDPVVAMEAENTVM